LILAATERDRGARRERGFAARTPGRADCEAAEVQTRGSGALVSALVSLKSLREAVEGWQTIDSAGRVAHVVCRVVFDAHVQPPLGQKRVEALCTSR
jgi:hypothetical protein